MQVRHGCYWAVTSGKVRYVVESEVTSARAAPNRGSNNVGNLWLSLKSVIGMPARAGIQES